MSRNIFVGRASEGTYPEVIKYGYFADSNPDFYNGIKQGDIGFLVVREDDDDKVIKEITKIIGPFITKVNYSKKNDLRELQSVKPVPFWSNKYPFYVEVEGEKPIIIMGQRLQKVITHLPYKGRYTFKKAIISQDPNYQDFIIELFLNMIL